MQRILGVVEQWVTTVEMKNVTMTMTQERLCKR